MPDADALSAMLQALSRFFVGASKIDDTLTQVSQLGVENLPGVELAGITLMRDGKPETSVFTDPEAPEVDRAQYDSGEGPCLDAFRDGKTYRIRAMVSESRWPAFVRTCLDHGIHSTLSLPLTGGAGGEAALGALNFYCRSADAAPREDDELAVAFADASATVLANARAYWDAYELSEGLTEAMTSRATIEQAKGILMGQSGFTEDEAFEALKQASMRENRKLRDIATDIVERTRRPR
jgi:GAF domain-containing protein